VVRFHDGNTNGSYLDASDNTLYVAQDANFNVTAVVNTGGTVVERYAYPSMAVVYTWRDGIGCVRKLRESIRTLRGG
jgi:hypothetical protein